MMQIIHGHNMMTKMLFQHITVTTLHLLESGGCDVPAAEVEVEDAA